MHTLKVKQMCIHTLIPLTAHNYVFHGKNKDFSFTLSQACLKHPCSSPIIYEYIIKTELNDVLLKKTNEFLLLYFNDLLKCTFNQQFNFNNVG